ADLLSRALDFHGFLGVIPPERYGGRQDADWQALGAELVVLGQVERSQYGVVLDLRMNDIQEGRLVLARRYRCAPRDQGAMIRKFCDEAILKLTGVPGISSTKIAFVSDASGHKEIWLADVLGEEMRQVTHHRFLAVCPRFSPDGRILAYTSYHRGNPDLYMTDLSQTKTTRAVSRRPGLNMAPAWSPDGRTLAITLSRDGNSDLYLMTPGGKIIEQLTKNAGLNVSASWSPDGSRLAFVSDRAGTPQIYIMDVKTKAVSRLTFQGNYNTSPSWSPQGDSIVYSGRQGGQYHLFTISPQGGTPVQITHGGGDHESPCWAPDGRQIVFARKIGGRQEICAIFRNGSGLRPLFPGKGNQSFPQWSPRLELATGFSVQ
ncbi:MAG: protein TolB, partial [Desulfobacteraceae bacterium]|nr:protein TolB [Desulfobacteraceae bacterium]